MVKDTYRINTSVDTSTEVIMEALIKKNGFLHQKEVIQHMASFFVDNRIDWDKIIESEESKIRLLKIEIIKQEEIINKIRERKKVYDSEEEERKELRMREVRKELLLVITSHTDTNLDRLLAKLYLRYNIPKERIKEEYLRLKSVINPDNKTETEKRKEEYERQQSKN
jgi:hypothetical protein